MLDHKAPLIASLADAEARVGPGDRMQPPEGAVGHAATLPDG